MRRSDEFLCPLSESGCRWSIDRVAEYLMRGLTYCKVAIPTVYTELPVSQVNKKDSKKKTQAVVAIIWRSKKTILTGRYDYLFLTFPYIKTRVIDPRKLELLEQNSFPTIRAKLTSFWLGRVRLFVLEAKRLMSAEALHAQLPQVIAQSRAA
ncbi:hypothetical protein BDN72DRAFT_397826 [Pluteus cervinus]|uniref:Uncharacterized protein n=1 Tax=Pluteus cervinus TaxID=181527 RepID=A0ACD3A9H5_9AGAR|nr:hypothetical protein BDN72DRAFT_397826 [Pluteus cervinus]